MNIAYCGNLGIYQGILLSTLSLIKHNDGPINLYLLTADLHEIREDFLPIGEKERRFLEQCLQEKNPASQVILLDCTPEFKASFGDSPNLKNMYTPYAMLRLLMDEKKEIPDKILYFDADVVVLKSVEELYSLALGDCDLAMVLDQVYCHVIGPRYCNSGVVLFDMEKIRNDHSFEKTRKIVLERKMIMPDQDALNIVYTDKKALAPAKFNEQRHINDETVIRHYCQMIRPFPFVHIAKAKPWQGEAFLKAYPEFQEKELLETFEEKKKLYAQSK